VFIESNATNFSLPVKGNLHRRPKHVSALSGKSNMIMLSAVEFLPINFLERLPLSGLHRI
jgi:hypothetical protein